MDSALSEVPWERLMTFYGRATAVPEMIRMLRTPGSASEACEWLAYRLEHQDGVVEATPLAVHFIIRDIGAGLTRQAPMVLALIQKILVACQFQISCHDDPGEVSLADIVKPEMLWPEFVDEETDEILIEEGGPPVLEENWSKLPFITAKVVTRNRVVFEAIENSVDPCCSGAARNLLAVIDSPVY